ncbi:hypothetical protein EVJ32_04840 [Exiguobacterium sp. SH5S4]|uniref:hypothetical protein n=1 Tax=Exiguobacterium sp. SH5S4 TaxID=2510961 RepID=UPI00103FCEF8|nr:hypothetical protein [Exiguobacterium sp. SH5S4]TCI26704.1 hypothetical protein EVJ32_04840 [Exiguobacterium sp. SH5S4]
MSKKTHEDLMEKLRSIPGYDEAQAKLKEGIDDLTEQFLEQGLTYKEAVWYATSIVLNDQYEAGEKYVLRGWEIDE